MARPGFIPARRGCPDPAPEVSTGPRGPWISYRALAGPSAPLHGPARPLRPCATPEGLQARYGCLEVSGGPARLLRASRHDMGCLEVSGGPAQPLRASRHDMGCLGLQTRFGCLEVSGGVWRPWSTSESLLTRFGVSGGVCRPCATPDGLQRAPDTSRRPPQVRSDSHQLAPVQVKVDGEAVRFRNLCPNASA